MPTINIDKREVPVTARNKRIYATSGTITTSTVSSGGGSGTGIQGTQGIQGLMGQQGIQGLGSQGIQGIQGRQGVQGSSAGVTSFNTRTGAVTLWQEDVEDVLTGVITSHSHTDSGYTAWTIQPQDASGNGTSYQMTNGKIFNISASEGLYLAYDTLLPNTLRIKLAPEWGTTSTTVARGNHTHSFEPLITKLHVAAEVNNSTTTAATFLTSPTLSANSTYLVEGDILMKGAATTTGVWISFTSNSVSTITTEFDIPLTAATYTKVGLTGWSGEATPGTSTTTYMIGKLRQVIVTGANTDVIVYKYRTEVNTSAVYIGKGTNIRITKIA